MARKAAKSKRASALPVNAARHIERHQAAARTLRAPVPVVAPTPVFEKDGRAAFPDVVEYRLKDGRLVGTPPAENDVVYHAVIKDLALYDWMRARGLTETGHRIV